MTEEKTAKALEDIRGALESGHIHSAVALLDQMDPVDRADLIVELTPEEQQNIFRELDSVSSAEILEELDDDEASELVANLTTEKLAEVLDEASPDVAADILGNMSEEQASSALRQMEEADDVRPLLQYPPETAGGLMTTMDFVVKPFQTAEEVIKAIRENGVDANSPYYLYVTDELGRLCGVIGLRSLIVAPPQTLISEIMIKEVKCIQAQEDQEQAAQLMKRYRLSLLPVVDDANRLLGIIFADDIAFILEEEATEDMYALAQISGSDVQLWSPFRVSIRRRLPWLIVNLGTAFLAASVVRYFEATITKAAVLAAFLGIVAGQGGNAATQTIAIVVRSIALNEVHFNDVYKVLVKEATIGLVNGIVVGSAVAVGAWYWHGSPALGIIVGGAMLGNMIAGALAGSLVPLTLKAVKLDPALASSVLVTTVTDSVGFGLILGLATIAITWFNVAL